MAGIVNQENGLMKASSMIEMIQTNPHLEESLPVIDQAQKVLNAILNEVPVSDDFDSALLLYESLLELLRERKWIAIADYCQKYTLIVDVAKKRIFFEDSESNEDYFDHLQELEQRVLQIHLDHLHF